jgi:hypothetical protein
MFNKLQTRQWRVWSSLFARPLGILLISLQRWTLIDLVAWVRSIPALTNVAFVVMFRLWWWRCVIDEYRSWRVATVRERFSVICERSDVRVEERWRKDTCWCRGARVLQLKCAPDVPVPGRVVKAVV